QNIFNLHQKQKKAYEKHKSKKLKKGNVNLSPNMKKRKLKEIEGKYEDIQNENYKLNNEKIYILNSPRMKKRIRDTENQSKLSKTENGECNVYLKNHSPQTKRKETATYTIQMNLHL